MFAFCPTDNSAFEVDALEVELAVEPDSEVGKVGLQLGEQCGVA